MTMREHLSLVVTNTPPRLQFSLSVDNQYTQINTPRNPRHAGVFARARRPVMQYLQFADDS